MTHAFSLSNLDLSFESVLHPELPKDLSIPIGCIGAGFIMAECHLVAYRKAGLNPIAISSRTRSRADEVAARHNIPTVYDSWKELLTDQRLQVIDLAVPPDIQFEVIQEVVKHADHVKGVLAQKPLGVDFAQAKQIVALCEEAGITLAVNQNMRYDQSIRACKTLIEKDILGEPVLASIDMRAIPHWMPWQERQGWVTLRIMSIHHLDTFRYWFGDPQRVFASVRTDPRTAEKFSHEDGICLYILEYENGLRATSCDDVWAGPLWEGSADDIGIHWRVEGRSGLAKGSIGWPKYPEREPSRIDFSTLKQPGIRFQPRWELVWFPDAFIGPMAQLLCALENNSQPEINGQDNLKTMALVDACYLSAREHRAVEIAEILEN